MAKQASIVLNVAIDKMRGKLATKQTDIIYAGQKPNETAFNLTNGRHSATNFQHYIVLNERRGKMRFYVKSNTSFGQSAAVKNAQAILALAATYSAYGEYIIMTRPEPSYQIFLQSYAFYREKDMTVREYLTRCVIDSIRKHQTYITFDTAPDPNGEVTAYSLETNPFFEGTVELQNSDYIGRFITKQQSAAAYQKYFGALYALVQQNAYKIKVYSKDLRTTEITLVGTDETNFVDLTGDVVQGIAYRIIPSVDQDFFTSFVVYNNKGRYFDGGVPYVDNDGTKTPLTKTTLLKDVTEIYLQAI